MPPNPCPGPSLHPLSSPAAPAAHDSLEEPSMPQQRPPPRSPRWSGPEGGDFRQQVEAPCLPQQLHGLQHTPVHAFDLRQTPVRPQRNLRESLPLKSGPVIALPGLTNPAGLRRCLGGSNKTMDRVMGLACLGTTDATREAMMVPQPVHEEENGVIKGRLPNPLRPS
ncbi:hypothetical protein NDU88_007458 [Pleurodeles waltl]|uniref:Uncharacterized protein n=1 Tax=Pleurodeles waltl TaxID=8319 RepID=A0AAV7QRS1_PLEWA|nr:hypothetical protein NDU88_007458 [Pleurodeles waltl]